MASLLLLISCSPYLPCLTALVPHPLMLSLHFLSALVVIMATPSSFLLLAPLCYNFSLFQWHILLVPPLSTPLNSPESYLLHNSPHFATFPLLLFHSPPPSSTLSSPPPAREVTELSRREGHRAVRSSLRAETTEGGGWREKKKKNRDC